MNVIKVQVQGGEQQDIPVQELAMQGMRIKPSATCMESLGRMSQNAIQIEARNDAASLLWLATFGPALLSVLAQYESEKNINEQKLAQEKANERVEGITVQ